MLVLLAEDRAQSGCGDLVAASLRKMAGLVARGEPACTTYHAARTTYHAARSADDSDVFDFYEEYRGETALLAHRGTPHFRALIEGTIVPLLISRERGILVPATMTTNPVPEA